MVLLLQPGSQTRPLARVHTSLNPRRARFFSGGLLINLPPPSDRGVMMAHEHGVFEAVVWSLRGSQAPGAVSLLRAAHGCCRAARQAALGTLAQLDVTRSWDVQPTHLARLLLCVPAASAVRLVVRAQQLDSLLLAALQAAQQLPQLARLEVVGPVHSPQTLLAVLHALAPRCGLQRLVVWSRSEWLPEFMPPLPAQPLQLLPSALQRQPSWSDSLRELHLVGPGTWGTQQHAEQAAGPGAQQQLPALEVALASMTQLQALALVRQQCVTRLPPAVSALTRLTALTYSHNNAAAPAGDALDAVTALVRLQRLDVRWNGLEELPAGIGQLTSLQSLVASDNRLRELPASFTSLSALTHLDLARNAFSVFPEQLSSLAQLRHLDLAGGSLIQDGPVPLSSLSRLTHLELGWLDRPVPGFVDPLPDALRHLQQIRHLGVRLRAKEDVSVCWTCLTALTTLQSLKVDVQHEGSPEALPTRFNRQLTSLSLCGYFIDSPLSLRHLTELTQLQHLEVNVRHNDLIASLAALTAVSSLELHVDRVADQQQLSWRLSQLSALRRLYVSVDEQLHLPSLMAAAPQLHDLEVCCSGRACNKTLTDLRCLSGLTGLTQLTVECCELGSLDGASALTGLHALQLDHCPVEALGALPMAAQTPSGLHQLGCLQQLSRLVLCEVGWQAGPGPQGLLEQLAQAGVMRCLQQLDVGYNSDLRRLPASFVSWLAQQPRLTHLLASECSWEDDLGLTAAEFAAAARAGAASATAPWAAATASTDSTMSLPQLQVLHLTAYPRGSTLTRLPAWLPQLAGLRTLSLDTLSYSSADAAQLAQALAGMPGLHEVTGSGAAQMLAHASLRHLAW